MLNVLVNAYAVSPAWGSEPGMGWNWVVNLAQYCNVFVITEGEWRTEIEETVESCRNGATCIFTSIPCRNVYAGCAGIRATGVFIGTTVSGKTHACHRSPNYCQTSHRYHPPVKYDRFPRAWLLVENF